jgi:hypothetical protein
MLVDFDPNHRATGSSVQTCRVPRTHPLVSASAQRASGSIDQPMQPTMAKSQFDWLTYNEPEGHLDDLVARLRQLPGITTSSRIAGLTYKDDSTLARLAKLGYANTYRIDARADLGLQDPCAGLESIQVALDDATASRLVTKHGQADLLLVRHVLEHAHNPLAFLRTVSSLVKPMGICCSKCRTALNLSEPATTASSGKNTSRIFARKRSKRSSQTPAWACGKSSSTLIRWKIP